jgi:lysophospholipase L1-like esterase
MPCVPNTSYVTKVTSSFVTFFDAVLTRISSGTTSSGGVFTTPANAAYTRVTVGNSLVDYTTNMVVKGTVYPSEYIAYGVATVSESAVTMSKYTIAKDTIGKKWGLLGDSITAGLNTTKIYYQYVAEEIGVTPTADGISGTCISAGGEAASNAMCTRYTNMSNDFDFVSVYGGINDYDDNVPLGAETSTDTATFYGGLNVLIEGLLAKYLGKPILFIAPHQITSRTGANTVGLYLTDYVDAIKNRCEYYSINFLDLHRSGGLYPTLAAFKTAYIPDGCHPNAAGHKILSVPIKHAVLSLF